MRKYLLILIAISALSSNANSSNCNNAESCIENALSQYRSKNYNEAASDYIKSCNYGKKKACTPAGDMSKKIGNIRNAELYFRKSCNFKDKFGCSMLGDLYLEMKPDRFNDGLSYKNIACDMGKVEACYTGGFAAAEKKLYSKARPFFERACYKKTPDNVFEVGMGNACGHLGYYYEYGLAGFEQDDYKAMELYKRGCEMKDSIGANLTVCKNYKGIISRIKNRAKRESYANSPSSSSYSSSTSSSGSSSNYSSSSSSKNCGIKVRHTCVGGRCGPVHEYQCE